MGDEENYVDLILKTLRGSEDGASMKVKPLRKLILLSMQLNENDKNAKKSFKKAIQSLESQEKITLSSEGVVKLSKAEIKKKKKKRKRENNEVENSNENDEMERKKREKKAKKEKKKKTKKQSSRSNNDDDDDDEKDDGDHDENDSGAAEPQEEQTNIDNDEEDDNNLQKNKPCKGNPQGVTRLFLGNLPFAVDETSLSNFLEPAGEVTHIKWITDKETGRFYGSAFIEMKHSKGAAAAVSMDGQELMNRPIKMNYAPAREGDVWPPNKKIVTGGKILKNSKGAAAGGVGVQALGEKPENCTKLFIGNLSYDIDDEGIFKFFGTVDAEVKAVRWLHHKDTGDFKGVGFVEFWNMEACERGATLNGKNLLGRPIRIDWTD